MPRLARRGLRSYEATLPSLLRGDNNLYALEPVGGNVPSGFSTRLLFLNHARQPCRDDQISILGTANRKRECIALEKFRSDLHF